MEIKTKADIFQFIYDHEEKYKVSTMCKLHAVSRGGYYAWCNRSPSTRELVDAELLLEIRRVFAQSNETYGSPRIYERLKQEGCTLERIELLELCEKTDCERCRK